MKNINDHTRILLRALMTAASTDREYNRKVSGFISAINQGILEVPFESHTNGRFWQLYNRVDRKQYTLDIQDGTLRTELVLA